jgi:hypothetical protein
MLLKVNIRGLQARLVVSFPPALNLLEAQHGLSISNPCLIIKSDFGGKLPAISSARRGYCAFSDNISLSK